MQKISTIILLSFLLSMKLFALQQTIDIATPQHRIGKSISYFEDKSSSLSFKQIKELPQNKFIPLQSAIHTKLFTQATQWYHFNVINKSPHTVERLFVFGIPWLDDIEIIVIDKDQKYSTYQGGDTFHYDQRTLKHPFPNFGHNFRPGISTIYIKVKTRDPFLVPISIIDKFTFLEEASEISNFTGFIYGIIVAMMLYNLFLFLNIKRKTYAYYVLYLGLFLLMNASYNCYTFKWFFFDNPEIQNWAESTNIFLFTIGGLLFAQSFLNLKRYLPLFHTITKLLILFYIVTMIITAFFGYHNHVMIAIALTVLYSLYVFGIALYSFIKGNRSARFFLLGISAGLLGTSITALTVMSLIPYSDIGFHAVDYGMVIDAILLSLALADHFKMIQEEKLQAEKEAKKATEAKKAKEEFLSNMSHEIRTPMNAILGFVQVLQKNTTDERNLSYLNIIHSSSQTLLHVINDILDFSKIESGKLIIEKHPFDTKNELEQISKLFEITAKEKSIELTSNIDPSIPDCLIGDLTRIKQIMFNFLSNAIKFTPEHKKISIKIQYKNESQQLFVSVKDEGIGMSLQAQKKIFHAFEQADNSTTRKFGGSGLGLSISLKLAKLMDGEISLESKEDKGSTFNLTLPLQICHDKTKLLTDEQTYQETVPKAQTFAGEILVAEDNKTNQMLIKLLLDEYKLNYTIANDGLEVVEAYKKSQFNLVLMDESMPNMTGVEAFKKIRQYEKDNQLISTPIIALTANVLEEDRKRFLEAGMDGFIAKPIDKNEFERVLKQFCKKM